MLGPGQVQNFVWLIWIQTVSLSDLVFAGHIVWLHIHVAFSRFCFTHYLLMSSVDNLWILIRLDILTFDILVGHIPQLITLVNSLGPDQVQNFVAPDLDILIELVLII